MGEEMTVDLGNLIDIVKKRIKLIALITFAATLTSGILSFFVIKPTYEAKSSIIIGKMSESRSQSLEYNDVMMYKQLIKTYSEIAKSRTVAEKTINSLNLDLKPDELSKMINVTPMLDTQIITIKVTNKNPGEASRIANAITKTFIDEAMLKLSSGSLSIMDNAVAPEHPSKPNKKLNIVIAFVLGLIVSLGIVLVIEYMDNTIKTENDVGKYLDLPVLGVIPKDMKEAGR